MIENRADILLQRDPADSAAAEQSLQAAIAIAQSQKTRSFELQATLVLAKLYRPTNHAADAHAVQMIPEDPLPSGLPQKTTRPPEVTPKQLPYRAALRKCEPASPGSMFPRASTSRPG